MAKDNNNKGNPLSLSEQLKIQRMYTAQINSSKTEVELLQDEVANTKKQLKNVKKKTVKK